MVGENVGGGGGGCLCVRERALDDLYVIGFR